MKTPRTEAVVRMAVGPMREYAIIEHAQNLERELIESVRCRDILASAMAEIKATHEGESDQPIADIIARCIAEIHSANAKGEGTASIRKSMNTPNDSTGGCCPPQPCSVVSFILQEWNDDDAMNPYWYDDLQPKGTETTEKKCRAYVTNDMRRNPRHYEACRHRIVRREETEIPLPNTQGEAQPPTQKL